MPKFKYAAIGADGARVGGVMEAVSAVRVRNELMSSDLQVLDIKERKSLRKREITKKKVKPADLMNFSRQLAAFLRAGIPILDALDALTEETKSAVFKQVLVDVGDALRSGSTLADGIAEHSKLFPRYYVGILRSAELTGNLADVLEQLGNYIERDLNAKRAVKAALTYPAVIMVMSVVTVAVLVVYVLPKFEEFFADFDAELPLPTRMLLGASRFLGQWWLVMGAVLVGLVVLFAVLLRTQWGKYQKSRLVLAIPMVGTVVRYAITERFCRILGAMLGAGVPVPEALSAAIEGTNNRVFQRKLMPARDEILRGDGLGRPLAATGLLPGAAGQMIRVGEESGTLDKQLVFAADFYETELEHKVKKLTTLFEPAVILVMGLIVGFVAVALVSAMYGLFNQVDVQ